MPFRRLTILSILALALGAPGLLCAEQTPDPELRERLRAAANAADSFEDRFDAEVWLTDMSARLSRQVEDPQERLRILTRVHYEATRAELPPELVLAVIEVESNFDRYAISVAGALGLMQVMPFWRDEIGRPGDNLIHVETNLRYGCTILRYYLDKEQGDLRRALGRYNGSLGKRKYPNKVIDKLTTKWFKS
jgi:soluble lytic murein transglycosylase-like protein